MKKPAWLLFLLLSGVSLFSQDKSGSTAGPELTTFLAKYQSRPALIRQEGQLLPDSRFTRDSLVIAGINAGPLQVMITPRGAVLKQETTRMLTHEEKEDLEKAGVPEEAIEHKRITRSNTTTLEWLNSSATPEVLFMEPLPGYYTYGSLQKKAAAFRKLVLKNAYPGIDVVYTVSDTAAAGFFYSLLVHPGAELAQVKLRLGGELQDISTVTARHLRVKTALGLLEHTGLTAFQAGDNLHHSLVTGATPLEVGFVKEGNEVSFSIPGGYNREQILVIDPFIAATGAFTGASAGIAKDIDFDYAGNVYVTGGGDGNVHQLSKYNANGILEWTFSGILNNPAWTFGPYFGGWVVEKTTGNVYLGQGFNPVTGFLVIRLNTHGLYDQYITSGNPAFRENWKMLWNCNNGSPQIMVAGGGTNSDINLGMINPPSAVPGAVNLTGITSIAFQDIADMVIDPLTNSMYTIYASGSVATLNNAIYKHTPPYTAANRSWNIPSGYPVLREASNRPYLNALGLNENSANLLALNNQYLFYWDGQHLKAFDKSTGTQAGTPVSLPQTALMQGGIVADACSHVYIGDANGSIKVYTFNGSTFDDAAAPDMVLPGFSGQPVYDLTLNESQQLLYVAGKGFIAALDVAAYCSGSTYGVSVSTDCVLGQASITLNPVPPAGSAITYTLLENGQQKASNSTGVFPSLQPGTTYRVNATINQACSGIRITSNFTMPGPDIIADKQPSQCSGNNGIIVLHASGSAAPYSFTMNNGAPSTDSVFSGLTAGVYTVQVTDNNGCKSSTLVVIENTDGPQVSTQISDAVCGNSTGTAQVIVTGGAAPYRYSINGGISYQNSSLFAGLAPGQYVFSVQDNTGCVNSAIARITSSALPQITAIPLAATCGNGNGSIQVFGTAGTPPLSFSINSNTYSSGSHFTGLVPGNYAVSVKDQSGCISSLTVTVPNTPIPSVSALTTASTCSVANGTLQATGNGGLAPYEFKLNNGIYQGSNLFTGLTPGTYLISVKDQNGCTAITSATVNSSSAAPVVSAVANPSSCSVNNGSLTIAVSGGTPGYQYSINGLAFQAGSSFTGLAAGNYVAYVRDAAGCTSTFALQVPNTSGPLLSIAVTPTSCSTGDGVITATGTGGSAPLQYSSDGINFQGSGIFSGLSSGTYVIAVKDANGCMQQRTVTLGNTSGLTVAVGALSSACNGSTGSLTAQTSGGNGTAVYSLDGINYQVSNLFSNLSPGNYILYAKDAAGCVVTKAAAITAVSGPSLTVTTDNPTCGTASGALRANAAGGTTPYTYSLDGGTFQSSSYFSGITGAAHTIQVKDAAGCITVQTVTLTNTGTGTPPTGITYSINNVLACTGGTGKIKNIKGVPSGGGNSYEFSLDLGAFTTANKFINVPAGIHLLTARNEDGCVTRTLVNLGNGSSARPQVSTTASVCNGNTGSITVTGIGGSVPYHVSLDGNTTWQTFFPPGANSYTFNNLAPGTHTVTMADDADFTTGPPDIPGACLTTVFAAVPASTGPVPGVQITHAGCSGNDGSISISSTGGTAPYTFSFNGGTFSSQAAYNNLAAGSYAVSVMDAGGCVNSTLVTLTSQGKPVISPQVLPASCNRANGSITLSASGGTGPLSFSMNGLEFQASPSFSNLAAGTYTLYARDSTGCYQTITAAVTAQPIPRLNTVTVNPGCNSNDGTIQVTGSGGTAPYQFSLDSILFQSSGSFSNLQAGVYQVYLQDSRGCLSETGVLLTNAAGPSFTQTISPATCGSNNATVTINASSAALPLQYSTNGIQYQPDPQLTQLAAGAQPVFVKDNNGCLSGRLITISSLPGPQFTGTPVIHAACNQANGKITATAAGGSGILQYSLDGITFQTSGIFNNVAAGIYTVTVQDGNNCVSTSEVMVQHLSGPSITGTLVSGTTCASTDGALVIEADGGTGTLNYSLNGNAYQSSPVFTGLGAGLYIITVSDTRGCSDTLAGQVIPAISNLSVSAVSISPSCGLPSGSITLNPTNGMAPLQFRMNGGAPQSASVFSGLTAGVYIFDITDAQGCSAGIPVNLTDQPAVHLSLQSSAACGTQGQIAAAVTGGTAPFNYRLNGVLYGGQTLFTGLNAGHYTIEVTDAAGCNDSSSTDIFILPLNPRTWLGLNSNWHDPVNWCGGVPALTDDVLIPSGALFYPDILTGTGNCNQITIDSQASVAIHGGCLKIQGNILNSGILDAVHGRLELCGDTDQVIAGRMLLHKTVHQLVISNQSAGGVSVDSTGNDTLRITGSLSFGSENARLSTQDRICLISSDTATASLNELAENTDGSARAILLGSLIIERFYPSKRAWRLITAPVKPDSNTPTINSAWQEGANPPSLTGVRNPDPHPGYGTHITGPWNSPTAYSASVTQSGFDQSPQNNSSMKYYSRSVHNFQPVTNTFTTRVTDYPGYLLFVRGDRSYDIGSTSNLMAPGSAILRVQGPPRTGRVAIPADTGIQVTGNPYPSTIQLGESFFVRNSAILKNSSYWIWDPLRGSARNSPVNVGGWIPVIYAGNGTYISTYDPALSIAGVDSAHQVDINGRIQSGAAFIIDNRSSAFSDSCIFHESDKTAGSNNTLFRPHEPGYSVLTTQLLRLQADNNKPLYWADGTLLMLKAGARQDAVEEEDVRKIFSSNENIWLRNQQAALAADIREELQSGDTLWYQVSRLQPGRYRLDVTGKNWQPGNGLTVWFQDAYTGTEWPLQNNGCNQIYADVNNDSGSRAVNRFRLVIKGAATLPITFTHFSVKEQDKHAVLQWRVEQQQQIRRYILEKSTDGVRYYAWDTTHATTHSSDQYAVDDRQTTPGLSYYRIKSEGYAGDTRYSSVQRFYIAFKDEWKIVPNPVTGRRIFLQTTATAGIPEHYQILNAMGQPVTFMERLPQTGRGIFEIQQGQRLPAGLYYLTLHFENNQTLQLKLMIQ